MPRSTIDDLRAKRLVWHYTTLEALQLILESGTLLATEVNYQNDPREPDTAYEAINDALADLGRERSYAQFSREALRWHHEWRSNNGFIRGRSGELIGNSRFIFCASTDPDNLYAWRTYAASGRTGCAIGLDPESPLGLVGSVAMARTIGFSRWSEVIYEQSLLQDFAVEALRTVGDTWNREHARDVASIRDQEARGVPDGEIEHHDNAFYVLLTDFAETCTRITAVGKHGSFREESETRVTLTDAGFGVVFTPGARGPRPRVKVAATRSWGAVVDSPVERLPIREIVLAPNAANEARRTAEWLLYANDYPLDPVDVIDESGVSPAMYLDSSQEIGIHRSAHPYRDV